MTGFLRSILAGVVALSFVATAWPQETSPATSAPAAQERVAAAVPSIEDFMAEASTTEVALAPSGRYVATVRVEDGVSYLTVRDVKEMAAKRTAIKLGNIQIYGLKWLNDDRILFSAGAKDIGVDYKRGQLVFTGMPGLFVINRDFSGRTLFFENDKKIVTNNIFTTSDITLIPNQPDHFIVPLRIGSELDLVRVDARDGTWTTVAEGAQQTIAWFVDREGQPAIRFDANRRRTEVRVLTPESRANGHVRWKQAFVVRFNRDRNKERIDDFTPIAPGPTPNLYYVMGRPNGADRIGIHLYDVETQQYTSEVFTPSKVDVESALVDPDTGDYLGAAYWNDKLEMTFSDKKMQAHFNGLSKYFGGERSVFFLDSSRDHNTWIIATTGPRDPGSYYVYDMAVAKAEQLGMTNIRLYESQLGKAASLTWKARDGLDISGYLTLPPGLPDGKKPPLIVYVHGGPEVRDTEAYDLTVQYLATRGYAVFQPNFRGSSGYGKAFAEAGRRQFGKAMQTDVVDGVKHVVGQGMVDSGRICIMGASYGGYAALMGVVQQPDLYRCAVAVSGPSDLHRQVRWERQEEGADSEAYKYWVAQIGDPGKDKAEMQAISPINNIAAIKVPVLIMHGRLDDTVPFEQAELMHEAMKKAGKSSKLVEFEGAGHGFGGDDLKAYLQQIESFFAQHLPVQP